MQRELGNILTTISELIVDEHADIGSLLMEFRLNCAEFAYEPNCEFDDEPCLLLQANELLTRSTLDHLIMKIQIKNEKIKKMGKIHESILNIVNSLSNNNEEE